VDTLVNRHNMPCLGISAGLNDIERICHDKLAGNRYQNIAHLSVGFRPGESSGDHLKTLLKEAQITTSLHPVDVNLSDMIEEGELQYIRNVADHLEPLYFEEDLGLWLHRKLFLESHLLNPIMSTESMNLTIDNVRKCREFLGIPIAIENPPVYWANGDVDFWDYFINIAEQADCWIAFDVGHFIGYCRSMDKKVYFPKEQSFVWDRINTLHLSGMKSWHWNGIPVWIDRHSELFNEQIIAVASYCLKKTRSLHNVVLEMEGASVEIENRNVDTINNILCQR